MEIPVHLEERNGLSREVEPVRTGVPLPPGRVYAPEELVVTDAAGALIPHQLTALGLWSDRSIKWLLMDALARVSPWGRTKLFIRGRSHGHGSARQDNPSLSLIRNKGAIEVDTGVAQFTVPCQGGGPVSAVCVGGEQVLREAGSHLRLTDVSGSEYALDVERITIEEQGRFRATVLTEGGFRGAQLLPLRFKMRTVFTAGTAFLRIDLQVRNTRAAVHPGGI